MARNMASASIGFGMVNIPVKIAKATSDGSPGTDNMCECGSTDLSYAENDDGDKVACKDCDRSYSWWNQIPKTGYETENGDVIELDPDEVKEAKEEAPVETGQVEKVTEVKSMLLQYNVTGNFYLKPEEGHEDQYGTLVRVLDEQDISMLTYFQMRKKTKRYAIISEGGVLMALELQDKRPIGVDIEYEVDEGMESQAKMMLENMQTDDPELEDVEGQSLMELIEREREEADLETTDEEDVAAKV